MRIFCGIALWASVVHSAQFGFENVQLTESDTLQYPAIRFGDGSQPVPQHECRYTPEDEKWPSDAEWARFNETLGGVLLKPPPLAISCYAGPLYDAVKCANLQRDWRNMAQQ